MKFSKRSLLVAGAVSGGAYVALAAVPYYRLWRVFSCAGHIDRTEMSAYCKSVIYPSSHDRLIQDIIMLLSYVFMAMFVLTVVVYISSGYLSNKK